MATEDEIKHKLQTALEADHVEVSGCLSPLPVELISHICRQVIDTSNGCGQGFDCIVVSEKFEGKKVLEKHR